CPVGLAAHLHAPGSTHPESAPGSRWKLPPATTLVRPPAHPTEEFWQFDLLQDSRATTWRSEPIWSEPARPVRAHRLPRRFDRPETRTRAAYGALPRGPRRRTAESAVP